MFKGAVVVQLASCDAALPGRSAVLPCYHSAKLGFGRTPGRALVTYRQSSQVLTLTLLLVLRLILQQNATLCNPQH